MVVRLQAEFGCVCFCLLHLFFCIFFFFFKQKTAYEIVSRDWSSDVCSSDLAPKFGRGLTIALHDGLNKRAIAALSGSGSTAAR